MTEKRLEQGRSGVSQSQLPCAGSGYRRKEGTPDAWAKHSGRQVVV